MREPALMGALIEVRLVRLPRLPTGERAEESGFSAAADVEGAAGFCEA